MRGRGRHVAARTANGFGVYELERVVGEGAEGGYGGWGAPDGCVEILMGWGKGEPGMRAWGWVNVADVKGLRCGCKAESVNCRGVEGTDEEVHSSPTELDRVCAFS